MDEKNLLSFAAQKNFRSPANSICHRLSMLELLGGGLALGVAALRLPHECCHEPYDGLGEKLWPPEQPTRVREPFESQWASHK